MGTTTYTFEDGTWAGATVYAWNDGDGVEIGHASFENDILAADRVTVVLDNGRTGSGFTTASAALAWIKENA